MSHSIGLVYSSSSPIGTKPADAPGITAANGIHWKLALVTWSSSGCPCEMPAGFCTKVTSFLCLLLFPLAFLASPSHIDVHYQVATLLVFGVHGSVVPTSLGVECSFCRCTKKRSIYLLARWFFCPAGEGENILGHGIGARQQQVLWVKMISRYSRGRTTTETFFLSQVKWPEWSSAHLKDANQNMSLSTLVHVASINEALFAIVSYIAHSRYISLGFIKYMRIFPLGLT